MGLDTFAYRKVTVAGSEAADRFSGINLCGGMFSGNGAQGSFRGKMYASAVQEFLGLDLYQHDITPRELRIWYHSLTIGQVDDLRESLGDEADDLMRFFKVCVDNGYGLWGSW